MNDPIEYIKKSIKKEDKKINLDFAFILPQIGNGTGGSIYIIELINYLSILGLNIGLISFAGNYDEIMNFTPISTSEINNISAKYLIATIFDSTFLAKKLAEKIDSKIIYFSQGYEFMFLEGTKYCEVESSFKIVDYVMTISDFLKKSYKDLFNIDSLKISNGINYDILHNENLIRNKRKKIFMNLRNESLKGGFVLNDILKRITIKCNDIDIFILDNTKESDLCVNNNPSITVNVIKGPISRTSVYDILKKCDVLIDSSFSEGFGLLPLEAMACGVVPVVSNALGNVEYCIDGVNSYLINNVNNPEHYVDKVKFLIENDKKLNIMKKAAIKTSGKYDFKDIVYKYKQTLLEILDDKIIPVHYKITDNDKKSLEKYTISDLEYNHIISMFKEKKENEIKNTRGRNIKILMKEYIKANIYILKKLVKTILDKDYKL